MNHCELCGKRIAEGETLCIDCVLARAERDLDELNHERRNQEITIIRRLVFGVPKTGQLKTRKGADNERT